MSRLLFWIALAVLVVFAIRAKLRELASKSTPAAGQRPAAAPPQPQSERMTSCAHCGVYFPASEAVTADGREYCCPAHVRLPPKN
ncbi:PP0621 family protein [Massilia horti]|uniref:Preprotein translocase subunit YajC n=1 Tax=Massilia horti TaxID=2562153 RepID=A0A4Y9T366_9BURK|nr:PP0621 family protein [Massilia horti]TFW34042.1 hypothetical protein E4O92_05140 [Massilia horti]